MSGYDEGQQVEQRSSIKIGSTAKGDPQVEVKVYAGTSTEEMDDARALAVAAYKATRREVGFPVAA